MLNHLIEKIGAIGTWSAALSCAACFPALGSLASAIGLGFLSQFEGIAVNWLLPIFAFIALLSNALNLFKYKNYLRGTLSLIGPIGILLTLYPLWQYTWSTQLFYISLALMLSMSLLDLFKPNRKLTCQIST